MAASNSDSLIIICPLAIFILLISSHSCSADTNSFSGSLCNIPTTNQTATWSSNLNNAFNSLTANVNRGNGYYTAEAGEAPDKAFALIQCRGDVSSSDCSNCTQESFRLVTENCGGSKSGVIWQKWCFLRYSNSSFYGEWERSGASRTSANLTRVDNSTVADAGMKMMTGLVEDAPNDSLMFARSETEDGMGWKRYGLTQCTRDLGRTGCGDCLNHFLKRFGPGVRNNTSWEIYGVGCFMMYGDHRFYFNSLTSGTKDSLPRTGGTGRGGGRRTNTNDSAANREFGGWFALGMAILTTAVVYI